ncbi:hypothetical protein [Streptomyces sp. NBC_01367]|uniref:hypothetical protein n=1 Tax=Streptomyces sp. NBC_01367 TaxID=2903841 RepID=UPI003253FF85
MPKIIYMPSEAELPPGARRRFSALLFHLYRDAGRPPLRLVSDVIAKRNDLEGTASRETVRRMLHGTVPTDWRAVEAVLEAFCDLGDLDPEDVVDIGDGYGKSLRPHLRELWNQALENPGPDPTDAWIHQSVRARRAELGPPPDPFD